MFVLPYIDYANFGIFSKYIYFMQCHTFLFIFYHFHLIRFTDKDFTSLLSKKVWLPERQQQSLLYGELKANIHHQALGA